MIYLQLFISYLKIGFFGFGGGYAMLSLIHNEVVLQNAWLTNEEFTNIVAISQMTPGPCRPASLRASSACQPCAVLSACRPPWLADGSVVALSCVP